MQNIKLSYKQQVSYETDTYFNKAVDSLRNCEDSSILIDVALIIIHILCIHISQLTARLKQEMILNKPEVSATTIQGIENDFILMSHYNGDKIANAENTLKNMPWEV